MTNASFVRAATADDIAAIEAIIADAYGPYVPRIGRAPAPMTADYRALMAAGEVRVLVSDAEPVGVLVTVVESGRFWIENVAIAPWAQGHGHGATLLNDAEQQARRLGLSEIRLYTNAAMTENLSLYAHLGYTEEYRRTQDGFDRVFFVKTV